MSKENLADSSAPNEKSSTLCDGELKQKKAFFAYFGKTFDDGKNSSADCIGSNSKLTDVHKPVIKQNIITKTSSSSKTPLVINTKKKEVQRFTEAVCIIKYVTF